MAMAATSAAVLGSPFVKGGKSTQKLFSSKAGSIVITPRKLIVAAAAAKKSWIPAVKGGGNFIDPEWLDGS